MELYEHDVIALFIFIIGVYVFSKHELEVTLSVGPTKSDGFVDSDSKYTKSRKIKIGNVHTKILGCILIAASYFMYATIKSELVFVW